MTSVSLEQLSEWPIRPVLRLPPLKDAPLVSVLIPSYNYETYIGLALESLLGQSFSNFEAVVGDDGSTDASLAIVESYARRETRIRVLCQPNSGMAAALNAAFSVCRGQI